MTSRSAQPGEHRAAALAALCTALSCVPARAQTAELVELTWDAPSGCPAASDVQARIRKLAASARPSGTALRADATITRDAGGGLLLELVIRAGDLVGERTIEGGSCDALAGAAAVNLALLLASREPLSAADVGAPPGASAAEPAKPAEPQPTQEQSPQPEAAQPEQPDDDDNTDDDDGKDDGDEDEDAPSTRSWRGLLDAPLGTLELGPTPEPSLGGALAIGLWIDRWRVLAEASLWQGQELTATTHLPASAEIDRFAATLRTCWTFRFGRFELAPCVHVSLQHVSARGKGPQIAARTDASTWVAPGVGVQGRYDLASWLALLASVDGRIEGSRPRIAIDGLGRVGQLGPAAVKIALGLEWIL
jgi:hypothetical protein